MVRSVKLSTAIACTLSTLAAGATSSAESSSQLQAEAQVQREHQTFWRFGVETSDGQEHDYAREREPTHQGHASFKGHKQKSHAKPHSTGMHHSTDGTSHHESPSHHGSQSPSHHEFNLHFTEPVIGQKLNRDVSRRQDSDQEVHVCLFTDRLEAIPVPIRSLATSTAEPENVHVWVVTVHKTFNTFQQYFSQNKHHFEGLKIHVLDLDQITNELLEDGVPPVWKWPTFGKSVSDPNWSNHSWSVYIFI